MAPNPNPCDLWPHARFLRDPAPNIANPDITLASSILKGKSNSENLNIKHQIMSLKKLLKSSIPQLFGYI